MIGAIWRLNDTGELAAPRATTSDAISKAARIRMAPVMPKSGRMRQQIPRATVPQSKASAAGKKRKATREKGQIFLSQENTKITKKRRIESDIRQPSFPASSSTSARQSRPAHPLNHA